MILVLVFFWLLVLSFDASVAKLLADFLRPYHALCLERVPIDSHFAPWMAAIVCAERLPDSAGGSDLQILGLMHIIIVSGAQLFLIEQVLRGLCQGVRRRFFQSEMSRRSERIESALLAFVLLTYGGMTSLPAPLLRAFIQLGLRRLSMRVKLFLRPAQITLVAGLLTLICAPELTTSLSLQFGWLASLVFSAPGVRSARERGASPLKARLLPTTKSLVRQIFFYLALFVPLLPLGVPHPISVICNWILAPALVLILFPLSVLTLMFHDLTPTSDFVWSNVLGPLHLMADSLAPTDWRVQISSIYGWIYLGCLQVIFLFREREPCPR